MREPTEVAMFEPSPTRSRDPRLLPLLALCCLSLMACGEKEPAEHAESERSESVTMGLVYPEEREDLQPGIGAGPPARQVIKRPRAKKVPIPDPLGPDLILEQNEIVFFDAPPDLEQDPDQADESTLPTVFEAIQVSAADISSDLEPNLPAPEIPAFDHMVFPLSPPDPAANTKHSMATDSTLGGVFGGDTHSLERRSLGLRTDVAKGEFTEDKDDKDGTKKAAQAKHERAGFQSRSIARQWLTQRSRVEGLTFKAARGYWANTYLPGDPGLRFLHSKLTNSDEPNNDPLPHVLSRRARPPFDPPSHAALGVHLHADQSALEGRSRVLLQVGLQATERFGGRRTAMNLAVVLHLPPKGQDLTTKDHEVLRRLLFSLAEQRDFEDRFTLLIAGRSGGLVLSPEDFRHGPVAVLCDQLARGEDLSGPTLDLDSALGRAIDEVAAADDPSAPLGSSGILWIETTATPSSTSIEAEIHSAAVTGLPMTTFGVGSEAQPKTLKRWALLGQGRYYRPSSADRAEGQILQELEAAARTVARAVRLNIRLAPGVELVDVLGSYPLGKLDAGRVRAVEKSVDLRLARRLGITADRGDDEDGIQIVVPSFYAGDYHTLLLDVVAEPGPIAEVTARFKDLVHLDNGVARAHLSLDRGNNQPGAYEHAVLLDHLAHDLQDTLKAAGDAMGRAQSQEARIALVRARNLLAGLALERPQLAGRPNLEEDLAMIEGFIAWIPRQTPWLDESLHYAGLLKIQPAPGSPES